MRLNSSIFYALMCSTAILHTSRGSPLPHLGPDRGSPSTPPSPAPDRGRSPGTPPSLASNRGSPTPSIDTSREDSGPKASFYLRIMLPGDSSSLQPASGLRVITPGLIHNFIKAGFIPGIAFRHLWNIGLRKQEIHPDSVHFDVNQALDPHPVSQTRDEHGKISLKYKFVIKPGNLEPQMSREICCHCEGSLTIVYHPEAPLDYSESRMVIQSREWDTDPDPFTELEIGPELNFRFYNPNPSDHSGKVVVAVKSVTQKHPDHWSTNVFDLMDYDTETEGYESDGTSVDGSEGTRRGGGH
ncbi:hypothetical protein FB446DRAFT_727814 [Lentinula raphanica]|nr:hypothetical protein FB446DRAFT_727814 [Lentinula raphanica]